MADQQWQDAFQYQQDRDAVSDSQWQAEFDESIRRYEESNALTREQMRIQQEQWQAEFDEEVRRFDVETELTKEQMETQKEQWKSEYDLDVQNAQRDYDLAIKRLEEDIRSNKVDEAQAQAQIDLAKEELAQDKAEAAAELQYKYDALDKEYEYKNNQLTVENEDGDTDPVEIDFGEFDGTDWEAYFSDIRINESPEAAAEELKRLIGEGKIPQKFISVSSTAARGGLGKHFETIGPN